MPFNAIETAEVTLGLSSAEAAVRLAQYGPNRLRPQRQHAIWQFLARFRNPLVVVLLVACVISAVIVIGYLNLGQGLYSICLG